MKTNQSVKINFRDYGEIIVPKGIERGKQVLKNETNLGFVLINLLSSDQLKIAREF